MNTHRVIALQEQHITLTNQLVGTRTVKDSTRVNHSSHTESYSCREVCLDGTSNDIGSWSLGSDNHVDTHSTSQLGDTCNRQLHFLTSRHDQVTKLINHHHDIRQETMSMVRIQTATVESFVIFFDIAHLGHLQQIIAGIHLSTQRVKRTHHLLHIRHHRLFGIFQLCQEMMVKFAIHAKLHLLRIHQHQLQFCRMLLIQQRSYHSIKSHRLSLTCSTSHQHVWHLGQVNHERFVADGLTQHHWQIGLALLERLTANHTLARHHPWRLVRHLNTDSSLARNRSDDTNTQCSQLQSDVIFQITHLGDTDTLSQSQLIQCDGRSHRCCNSFDFNTKATQHLHYAVLVLLLLLHIYTRTVIVEVLHQVQCWEFIMRQV